MHFNQNNFHIGFNDLAQDDKAQITSLFIAKAKEHGIPLEQRPIHGIDNLDNIVRFEIVDQNILGDISDANSINCAELSETLQRSLEDAVRSVSDKHQVNLDGYGQIYVNQSMGHDL